VEALSKRELDHATRVMRAHLTRVQTNLLEGGAPVGG
jgi:DNA-binding FadR family transcriptional regulator